MAYVHPVYHGGKNYPEQVTEEYLTRPAAGEISAPRDAPLSTAERMHHKSAVSHDVKIREHPPGSVPAMSKNLFVNTQIDRLLRRHNKNRGRDDTFYNIPCQPVPSTAVNLTKPCNY